MKKITGICVLVGALMLPNIVKYQQQLNTERKIDTILKYVKIGTNVLIGTRTDGYMYLVDVTKKGVPFLMIRRIDGTNIINIIDFNLDGLKENDYVTIENLTSNSFFPFYELDKDTKKLVKQTYQNTLDLGCKKFKEIPTEKKFWI